MPPTTPNAPRPTLVSLDFAQPIEGQRLIEAVWRSPNSRRTQAQAIGALFVPRPGEELEVGGMGGVFYFWHLSTDVVKADFLCETNDATDSRPLAAARWIIRAAYRACGYGLYAPAAE